MPTNRIVVDHGERPLEVAARFIDTVLAILATVGAKSNSTPCPNRPPVLLLCSVGCVQDEGDVCSISAWRSSTMTGACYWVDSVSSVCTAAERRSASRANNTPTSNSIHIGTASMHCEMTSGPGVSTIPTMKHPTIT